MSSSKLKYLGKLNFQTLKTFIAKALLIATIFLLGFGPSPTILYTPPPDPLDLLLPEPLSMQLS